MCASAINTCKCSLEHTKPAANAEQRSFPVESPKAYRTSERAESDLLIQLALEKTTYVFNGEWFRLCTSFICMPSAWEIFVRSLPAKSTFFIFLLHAASFNARVFKEETR